MYNKIFVNEKWFYLCQINEKLFITRRRPITKLCYKQKNIQKVLFLCAVDWPHNLPTGELWGRKIGIWFFTE